MSTTTDTAASATTTAPLVISTHDFKLVPIVIALVSFCSIGIIGLCVMTACNMRRMRRLLEEQRNNPHAHRNAVDDQGMPEKPGLPLKPIITTIKLENKVWDYHNKVDWSNVMPLSAELISLNDNGEKHDSSQDDSASPIFADKSTNPQQLDLGVLINLPSHPHDYSPLKDVWVNASKSLTSFTHLAIPEEHISATVIGSSRIDIRKLR